MTTTLLERALRTIDMGRAAFILVAASLIVAGFEAPPAFARDLCPGCQAENDTSSSPGNIGSPRWPVDRAVTPPIVFVAKDSEVHCALPAGDTWIIETVDPIPGAGGCSITLDDAHDPLIAYHDRNGMLFWSRRLSSGWTKVPIDRGSFVPGSTSIARVPAGLAIAYVDAAAGILRYAEQDASGAWHIESVAPAIGVEAYPSLVVDGSLRAISYYDPARHDLRLALRTIVGGWTTQTIDNSADVGGYSSLVGQPSQGVVGVAYYDFTHGDLRYAHGSPGGGFTVQTVDAGGDVGRFCSAVAFAGTAQDHVGITYYDRDHGDLKYALLQGETWSLLTLDAAGDVGRHASCGGTLVPGDTLGVAYVDNGTGTLKYLLRTRNVTAVPAPPVPHGAMHVTWERTSAGGRIRFNLASAGPVRVTIYDAQGRRIAAPFTHELPVGAAEVDWNGRDSQGLAVRSGVCFVRVAAGGESGVAAAVLVR